jgi:hypothetical protein
LITQSITNLQGIRQYVTATERRLINLWTGVGNIDNMIETVHNGAA